jgi:hypothetical protein
MGDGGWWRGFWARAAGDDEVRQSGGEMVVVLVVHIDINITMRSSIRCDRGV